MEDIPLRLNELRNIADHMSCEGTEIKSMHKSTHGCRSRPSAIVGGG